MANHEDHSGAPAFTGDLTRRALLRRSVMMAAAGFVGPSVLAACDSATDAGTAATSAAGGATSAAPTASSATPADGLMIKAIRNETGKQFKFGCQAHVRANIWSDALESGWKQAEKDLGFKLTIGGPSKVDPAAQVAEIESWIVQKFDCIMVSAAAAPTLAPSLNKAVDAGIAVVTIDSDAPESKRQAFALGANSQEIAFAQIDSLARQMNSTGEWAFIFGQLTQIEKKYQFDQMQARAKEKYPDMKFVGSEECKDDQQVAANQAQALIVRHPNLGGIISNSGSGCIGAAQGIAASGKSRKVKVTGITFASLGKQYVEDGTMPEFFLWDITHQAYFSAALGMSMLTGKDIRDGDPVARFTGKSEPVKLQPSDIDSSKVVALLGPPLKIDASNVATLKP